MASFENLKNGRVRASVHVNGIRDSRTLSTLTKAKSWARDRESELSKLDGTIDCTKTFGDLFKRYADEISSQKGGAHWEQKTRNGDHQDIYQINLLSSLFSRSEPVGCVESVCQHCQRYHWNRSSSS